MYNIYILGASAGTFRYITVSFMHCARYNTIHEPCEDFVLPKSGIIRKCFKEVTSELFIFRDIQQHNHPAIASDSDGIILMIRFRSCILRFINLHIDNSSLDSTKTEKGA